MDKCTLFIPFGKVHCGSTKEKKNKRAKKYYPVVTNNKTKSKLQFK